MIVKNYKEIIENGQTEKLKKIRTDIVNIIDSVISSIDPYRSVESFLKNEKIDESNFENIYFIGFGKASIGMAQALSKYIKIKKGAIITNQLDKKVNSPNIQTLIGSHPIPDEKSIESTEKLIEIVKECKKNDLLFVLISGGGSALFSKPRISLNDLQKTTDLLLKSGANINEINTLRKHLSFVKGGQLAKICNCQIISLIISDIINDPIEFIASGPTYPDSTTFIDCEKIIQKYKLVEKIPNSVIEIINKGKNKEISETPKENDISFLKVKNFIVANNKIACNTAKEKAKKLGYNPTILTTSLKGEAREVGNFLVEKTINYNKKDKNFFICGGETTVTIKGKGKGGRNQEMVLSTIDKIANKGVVFCSFGTDGIDGTSLAAGAIADSYTKKRAEKSNLNINIYLNNNDSNSYFDNISDSIITGATGTNVMDLQFIINIT